MTEYRDKVGNMVRNAEKMELEALIELVHDSFFMEYWENASITMEKEMEKDTGEILWHMTEYTTGFDIRCYKFRYCYEELYREILEHCYRKEIATEEWEEEQAEKADTRKWIDDNCGVAYGRY